MVDKPSVFPQWASNDVQDPISQQFNVVEPPLEKKTDGWFLGEKPNRQWWNWFQRTVYDWILWLNQQESYTVTTDDAGVGLFTVNDALITITAVDLDDPTSVLEATGIKVAGQPPQFAASSIVATNLALGVGTVGGTQAVTGGTNVIVTGISRVIPT
jgi:hypothetical protein